MKYSRIYPVLILVSMIIGLFLFRSWSQDTSGNIDRVAKQAEERARNLPAHEKKIAGIILEKIDRMIEDNARQKINTQAMVKLYSTQFVKVNKSGRIYVNVNLKRNSSRMDMQAVQNQIKNMGGKIQKANYPEIYIDWMPEIYCWIPFDKVKEIAKDSLVTHIDIVPIAYHKAGDYNTLGDTQLRANLARQYFGVDGSGVRVGVISDGIDHWDQSSNSGDLPQFVYRVTNNDQGDEGTAMLEIVHDLAPGAELYFGGVGAGDSGGPNDMVDTIFTMAVNHNCKVIVDDIMWLGVPFFYEDDLMQSISYYINQYDISYISAAGNDGETCWDGYFNDDDNDDWHEFWREESTPYNYNRIFIEYGETITVLLQWSSDWENPQDNYDLYLLDMYENVVESSTSSQPGNHPEELIEYTNNVTGGYFKIKVKKISGIDRELKVMVQPSTKELDYTYPNYEQGIDRPVRQIFGHPAARKVISTAAYSAYDQSVLEDYSSRGPTRIYVDPDNFEIRKTPTITATDNVETKIGSLGYFSFPFGGTSAAAPHIAGIAALYYDKYGIGKPPEDFYADLTSSGVSIHNGTGGVYNDQSGYGKADALETLGGIGGVTVHQLNHAGDDTGEFEHWGGSVWEPPYTAPHTFDWQAGTDQTLRAEQNIWNGEKFQYWNSPDTVINHFTFNITEKTIDLNAQLWPVNETTVKTDLGSANTTGGSIDFKDPWLIDYNDPPYGIRNRGLTAPFKTYPSPLNITLASQFKGVFLNQGWPNWEPPYYSVRAPNPQVIPFHGQPITWYFQQWSGAANEVAFQYPDQTETAVVFKQDGAVARAVYKGHLVSSSPEATAFNNGRQIAYEYDYPTSNWHLVYEDAGQIYYTYSTDGGLSWHTEKKLSYSETGSNSQPSIFLFQSDIGLPDEVEQDETSPILLGVVWNREIGYLNNTPVLRFMRMNKTWSPEIMLNTVFPYHCQPVISGRMENYIPQLYVVSRYNPIGSSGLALFKISEAQPWFSRVSNPLITGTSIYSINPSITVDRGGVFHFCWEETNKIYYSNYAIGSYFPEPLEISGPAWEGYNHRPSITTDYLERINVVWEQQGISYPGTSFNHRQYFDDEWGAIQRVTVHYHFLSFPSIGAVHESEIGELKSSFVHETLSEDDPHINWLSYNGEKWNWQPQAFPGQHPGMSAYGLELMTVWTNHTLGLPYMVKYQHWDTDELVGENRESLSNDHYRTLLVDLKDITANRLQGQVSLSIGKVEVLSTQGTQAISFPALSDSLSQQCFTQTSSFFVTENFQQLNFQYRLWMKNFNHAIKIPKTALYKIILQENTANIALLRELNLSGISTDSLDFQETVTINLLPLRGKTISLKMLVLPEYQSLLQNYITRVNVQEYSGQTVGDKLVMESCLNEQVKQVPKEFALSQNYPNPFNPTTTIAFDLPGEVNVRLEIFDVSGRLICTLMDEPREAGSYQVIWNGQDDRGHSVASGVYVYRIQAGDFVQSRKLLFMK